MRCRQCNRPIHNVRSVIHGRGPVCWARHLTELQADQRELELFAGYSWAVWGQDQYIVTNPEHDAYCVDLAENTCTCADYLRKTMYGMRYECKHLKYVRLELRRLEEEREAAEEEKAARKAERLEREARKAERRLAKTAPEIIGTGRVMTDEEYRREVAIDYA